jgi:hypothetical protein
VLSPEVQHGGQPSTGSSAPSNREELEAPDVSPVPPHVEIEAPALTRDPSCIEPSPESMLTRSIAELKARIEVAERAALALRR